MSIGRRATTYWQTTTPNAQKRFVSAILPRPFKSQLGTLTFVVLIVHSHPIPAFGQRHDGNSPAAVLVTALKASDAKTRQAAAEEISRRPNDFIQFVETLIETLTDPDDLVQEDVAQALVQMKRTTISASLKYILNSDEKLQLRLLRTLCLMYDEGDKQLEAVCKAALQDKRPSVRMQATLLHGSQRPFKSCLPDFINIVKDATLSTNERHYASLAIARYGKDGSVAKPSLVGVLGDSKAPEKLRASCAGALTSVAPNDMDVVNMLHKLLKDERESLLVQYSVVHRMTEFPEYWSALRHPLRQIADGSFGHTKDDSALRSSAVRVLTQLPPEQTTAEAMLVFALDSFNPDEARLLAVRYLMRWMKRFHVDPLPLLQVLTEVKLDEQLEQEVVATLKAGAPPKRLLDKLKNLADTTNDGETRSRVASVIDKLKSEMK